MAVAGVRGEAVTPSVLDHLHRASEGATLAVNVRLVLRNAELAGCSPCTEVTEASARAASGAR